MTLVRIAGKLKPSNITISGAASKIPTTAVTGRITLLITNNGNATLYIGDSTVTVSNGTPIEPGEKFPLDLDANVDLYGITAGTSVDIRVLEGV